MYLGWFNSKDDVANGFRIELDANVNIHFAWYDDPYGYSGEAFVLFSKGNKLYEVNGSHCSCYGLEGQWEPEETSIEALRYRIENGSLGRSGDCNFVDDLNIALSKLSNNSNN